MSNNDQQLVDHLYNSIFIQKSRYDHFSLGGIQPVNSVWNKQSDEKAIFEKLVENYKDFYRKKADIIKDILGCRAGPE